MTDLFVKPIAIVAAAFAMFNAPTVNHPPARVLLSTLDPAQILGFARSASGAVNPQVRIAGERTKLARTIGLALGPTGNIYAVNAAAHYQGGPPSIAIFSPGANGDARPLATITCGMRDAFGAAVDGRASIHVTDPRSAAIFTFASGAVGCVAAQSSIQGSRTLLSAPTGIALDRRGRTYVTNSSSSSINVYAAGTKGNMAPIARVAGPHTGLSNPEGIVFDPEGNFFATNYSNDSVTEYAPSSNGDVSPVRTISGNRTQISAPIGIAVSKVTGEIFVACLGTRAILVFAPNAQGNVPPARIVADAQMQLFPAGIALSE